MVAYVRWSEHCLFDGPACRSFDNRFGMVLRWSINWTQVWLPSYFLSYRRSWSAPEDYSSALGWAHCPPSCPHTSAKSRTRKSEVFYNSFSLEHNKVKSFIKPIPKYTIYRYTVYLNTNIGLYATRCKKILQHFNKNKLDVDFFIVVHPIFIIIDHRDPIIFYHNLKYELWYYYVFMHNIIISRKTAESTYISTNYNILC